MAYNSNAARSYNAPAANSNNNKPEIGGYLNFAIPRKSGANMKLTGVATNLSNAGLKALHDFIMEHIEAGTEAEAYEAIRKSLVMYYVPTNQDGAGELAL